MSVSPDFPSEHASMSRPVFAKQDRIPATYPYPPVDVSYSISSQEPLQAERWLSNPSAHTPSPTPSADTSSTATDKKRHVCPTCNKAFTTSGHLSRHARVHTGERNHRCPFPGCETRCSRQDNLQQHYRIHLSPGSRRNSSSRSSLAQVLASATDSGGIKKRPKAPSITTEDSGDSPPSTPPALELAFAPPPYVASEPSPALSSANVYTCGPEKATYDLDRSSSSPDVAHTIYYDFRGPQERTYNGEQRVYSEQLPGSYSPQSGSYPSYDGPHPPSSGPSAQRGLAAVTEFSAYDTYSSIPVQEISHSSSRPAIATSRPVSILEQPQPQFSYLQGQYQRPLVSSSQYHSPQISHSDSPSPVSSLSISSQSSDPSSLYESPRDNASGLAYAPSDAHSSYPSVDRYRSPPPALSGPGDSIYRRGASYLDGSWSGGALAGARVAHDPRTPGMRFTL